MLATGSPHHAHRGFADAVDADIVSMPGVPTPVAGTVLEDALNGLRTSPPDYDVYLLEGSGGVYVTPRIALATDATVVYVCDDHRMYGVDSYDFSSGSTVGRLAKRTDRRVDAGILRTLVPRYVDGVIAGSGFMANVARRVVGADVPIRVASPYIQPDVYERLGNVEPDLASNTAVTVGIGRDHKGVDLLVEAWPAVRNQVPDAELRIVGPGYPETYEETSGVELLGYVEPEHLHEVLAPCSLYLHPARAEAFGVTVVEAMCAGLPAIVTETTGARSAVQAVDKSMIIGATSAKLSDHIVQYFESGLESRQELSARSRDESGKYDAETGRRTFREQFQSVLETIHD